MKAGYAGPEEFSGPAFCCELGEASYRLPGAGLPAIQMARYGVRRLVGTFAAVATGSVFTTETPRHQDEEEPRSVIQDARGSAALHPLRVFVSLCLINHPPVYFQKNCSESALRP